jgi:ATP-dependent RNA helicase UAP56/SUB2
MKGLRQYYIKLHENEKQQKLIDLLGKLEFNQTVIFVKSVSRCMSLCQLLIKENFPAIEIHQEMAQEQRFVHFRIKIK